MKNFQYQRWLLAFFLTGTFSVFNSLQAQFVVYDPSQFGNMIQSLGNEAKLIAKAAETLKETRHILQTTIQTKEEVENIYGLQWDVQEAFKLTGNIRDLKWSDLGNSLQQAAGVSVNPHVYLPDIPETYSLRQKLEGESSTQNTRQLFDLLTGIHSFTVPMKNFADYEQKTKEVSINQFSLEEMSNQKKVQTALSYNQLAEEMIVQANELMMAVKTDRRLTMNEAERLSLLKQCQDVLTKSMEMKLAADELLRSVSENRSESKDALLQSYRNQLVRKALAETPQMKYGQ